MFKLRDIFKKNYKYTVYIIDDEEDICEIYQEIIIERFKDINVKTFTDPELALEDLKNAKIKPSVILCDLNMPKIKGLELKLNLEQSNIKLPFIFISGLDGENIIRDNYTILSKPIDFDYLSTFLDKYLERK